MHFPHGDQAVEKIRFSFRIRLVYDTFIAFSGGAGLIGIDPGNEDQTVCYFFLEACQAGYVVTDRVLVVCRAGADDNQKFIGFSGENTADLFVPAGFDCGQIRIQGVFLVVIPLLSFKKMCAGNLPAI